MTTTINPLARIARRTKQIHDELHREAVRDRCKGDICVGWDWPTLRIVKPKEYAELMALREEYVSESRSLRAIGLHPQQRK